MTSYLKSWIWSGGATTSVAAPVPTINTHDEDEDGSDTETEDNVNVRVEEDDDDDVAPAFPSLNSAQRLGPSTSKPTSMTVPRILGDSDLMPPPPIPRLAVRVPGVQAPWSASSSLQLPGRSTGAGAGSGSLAVPPSTTKAPPKPSKKREKVALAPGHSALDWANLKSSGADLRVSIVLLCSRMALIDQLHYRASIR